MNYVPPKTRRRQPRCQICGRELQNTESINRGIGPECLQKRSSGLAASGSSVEEIESLSSYPAAQRWIRAAYREIGGRRPELVQRFIEAARKARPITVTTTFGVITPEKIAALPEPVRLALGEIFSERLAQILQEGEALQQAA